MLNIIHLSKPQSYKQWSMMMPIEDTATQIYNIPVSGDWRIISLIIIIVQFIIRIIL